MEFLLISDKETLSRCISISEHDNSSRSGKLYPPLVCGSHTQQILHLMTSPLVSVLFVPSLHPYNFSRKFLFFSSVCAFGVFCASHPQAESSRFLDNSHNSPHCLSSPCTVFRTTMRQSCSLIPFHLPVGKVRTVCTGHKHSTQHIHAHYDTYNYMHAYRHMHTLNHGPSCIQECFTGVTTPAQGVQNAHTYIHDWCIPICFRQPMHFVL